MWRDLFGGRDCDRNGFNGVRTAHRNAWQLIQMANTSMAVFEDDVVATTGVDVLVRAAQAQATHRLTARCSGLFG